MTDANTSKLKPAFAAHPYTPIPTSAALSLAADTTSDSLLTKKFQYQFIG